MKWYLALKVVEKHKQVTPKMAADAWISVKTAAFSTKKLMAAALFGLKVFFLNHISFFLATPFDHQLKAAAMLKRSAPGQKKYAKKTIAKSLNFFWRPTHQKKV